MRIAIHHNLPSGGGKRALYEMTRRLANRHEVDVYTFSSADHDFCDLRPHCHRHQVFPFVPIPLARRPFGRMNQGIRALDLLRLRRIHGALATRIDAGNYDVVFVHHCRYGQSPSLLQFLKTPSVYYCQEPPRHLYEPPIARPYRTLSQVQLMGNLFDPLPDLYRRTLTRQDHANVQAASRILVNSHYSRETLYRTYGIFARVASLGVDLGVFRPLALSRGYFALSVGAIDPHKGFDFIVESLALLPLAIRLPLVIVSNWVDAAERVYLEALAQRLSVELEIKTMVTDFDLVELYNRATLVLYAPVMEPFGFVPLEAMACGAPVVGVREAGVRESIIHEQTGLLTDREPRDFADGIDRLVRDADLREHCSAAGLELVRKHWTWDQALEQIEMQLGQTALHSRRR